MIKKYLFQKKKLKRQKTVLIHKINFKNEDNILKNCISSKGIVKVSKPSFFAKNAFQRIQKKKRQIILKLNLLLILLIFNIMILIKKLIFILLLNKIKKN